MIVPEPSQPIEDGNPNSIFGELRQLFFEIRKYRAAELPESVESIIQQVANDDLISGKVTDKLRRERRITHARLIRIIISTSCVYFSPTVLAPIVGVISPKLYHLLNNWPHRIPAAWILVWIVSVEWFLLSWGNLREEFPDSYAAAHLVRALELGARYEMETTNTYLRDQLALRIERGAARYAAAYRRSSGTRFFAIHVRAQAKACRDDILSLVPLLVTADSAQVEQVNVALARLVIRSQTGYWYQTKDIAAPGGLTRGRLVTRASINVVTFLTDRTVQVAIIALIATVIAAVIVR